MELTSWKPTVEKVTVDPNRMIMLDRQMAVRVGSIESIRRSGSTIRVMFAFGNNDLGPASYDIDIVDWSKSLKMTEDAAADYLMRHLAASLCCIDFSVEHLVTFREELLDLMNPRV